MHRRRRRQDRMALAEQNRDMGRRTTPPPAMLAVTRSSTLLRLMSRHDMTWLPRTAMSAHASHDLWHCYASWRDMTCHCCQGSPCQYMPYMIFAILRQLRHVVTRRASSCHARRFRAVTRSPRTLRIIQHLSVPYAASDRSPMRPMPQKHRFRSRRHFLSCSRGVSKVHRVHVPAADGWRRDLAGRTSTTFRDAVDGNSDRRLHSLESRSRQIAVASFRPSDARREHGAPEQGDFP